MIPGRIKRLFIRPVTKLAKNNKEQMNKVLISGGTGLIGTALVRALKERDYDPIVLSRSPREGSGVRMAQWDVKQGYLDEWAIREADVVIHLAGANVAGGRWTEARKRELKESRVLSGALLTRSLREIPNHVHTFISASAIGWYGADPVVPNPHPFKETDPAASDFLGQLCKEWEAAVAPVADLNIRLCYVRTGIVLSPEGGAYKEFEIPMKFRVRGVLGSGRQIVSWIHIDDMVRVYLYLLEHGDLHGVFNAVAPQPVSNAALVKAMTSAAGGFFLPVKVPAISLKLGLGEMSAEVLKSTTVSADKIQQAGFSFSFPGIEGAAGDLNRR